MDPRVDIGIWSLLMCCGCLSIAHSQAPLTLRLERNWFVPPSAPLEYVVEHVRREHGDGRPLVFGLETDGPPVPFRIDPASGTVYVNDTLSDKANRTYSLWVTASNGDLPNKVEVLAVISDSPGYRPRPPRLPPFPGRPTDWGSYLKPPKTPFTTQRTTEFSTEDTTTESRVTTTTAATLGPPKPPEDLDRNVDRNATKSVDKDDTKEKNVSREEAAPESDLYVKVVPLAAVAGLVVLGGGAVALLWRRSIGKKAKSKKEDMSKEPSGMVMQDTSLNGWHGPRAFSNRYEAWDNSHLQIPENGAENEGVGFDDENKEHVHDEWEFPRHRLRVFNIVGEGAFGQVWRAQAVDIDGCKGEVTVAVKTLKENASEKERSDLLQELEVMKGLGSHTNVVRLLACCTDKEPTFVIMEFVQLGKLQSFLRDSRAERHYGNTHGGSNSLTSRDLTHFAYQVARGMHYLSNKGIIHRDLAARNVLITEERTCKVADFGFARDVADTHVYERKSDGRLPIRWMAPESLYDDIFSMKSDIWGFGVLVWEIVTLGSTPYPGLSAADVMRKVREGYRLEKPEHCRRELYNIMYYCWEAEPAGRPDFEECVTLLERLLCTETDYIELERFPDHSYYNVQHLDGEKL